MLNPSQYPYTLNRFFQHLREAVMYFPDNQTLKLNTFAWIDSLDQLNADNLGYDVKAVKSDYFFSKRYEKKKTSVLGFDYPVLLIAEDDHNIGDLFKGNNQSQKIGYNIKLWILDVVKTPKETTSTNADRFLGDVYRDTRITLLYVLTYLSKIKFYKITNLDSSLSYGYYHPSVIAKLQTDSLITSYESKSELEAVNSYFKTMIEKNTESILGIQEPISKDQVAGTYLNIKLDTAICYNPSFDFNFESQAFIYAPEY